MVDTLKYLKKGGRITPAVATLGTLLRLKPVLQIQGERLDTFSKARTVAQARSIMIAEGGLQHPPRFAGRGLQSEARSLGEREEEPSFTASGEIKDGNFF